MELKIKKMQPNAMIPTRGDQEAAGIDLYACVDYYESLKPGETKKISSGIACEFPEGYFGLLLPRSSVGVKRHLTLANTAGVIDNSYRGEIIMAFKNDGEEVQIIENGERLAQLILLPYIIFDINEVDTLSETERGEGGFGSTGR